jgi:hypothetical protein
MMNQANFDFTKAFPLLLRGRLCSGLMLMVMCGCGQRDADSSIVDPPSPSQTVVDGGPGSSRPKDLSGGLELPAGDLPDPADTPAERTGGFEMPDEPPAIDANDGGAVVE